MVSGIIAKGFGYESNGSVYFDVPAFQRHKKTTYGKLVPENVGNIRELEEGEGATLALAAPPALARWHRSYRPPGPSQAPCPPRATSATHRILRCGRRARRASRRGSRRGARAAPAGTLSALL